MPKFTVTAGTRVSHFSNREAAMDHARKKGGVVTGPIMAFDAAPTKQFKREQYAGLATGEDIENEIGLRITPDKIEQIMELLGDDDTAKRIRYLLDGGMSCDTDPLTKLRDYLKRNGTLSDAEIEEAVEHARQDAGMGKDMPPDLPSGGRPTPGGRLTPLKKPGAIDARSAAMDQVMKVPTDFVPPVRKPATAVWELSSLHNSSSALASFAARWPDAVKIGQA